MGEPIAYFLTWTTYGTWLPGDPRGWVKAGEFIIHPGDPEREAQARRLIHGEPITLTSEQRLMIEQTIRDHCWIRRWTLHAVNVRTNHVHVVVTADRRPEAVMNQFKVWCSRRLNAITKRERWWTEHGSTRWLNDEKSFWRAIEYVMNAQ